MRTVWAIWGGMVMLLAGIVLAACGSRPAAQVGTRSAPAHQASAPGSLDPGDPHYRLATAEAKALLDAAPLPPGASAVTGRTPEALSGPIMGTPSSNHLVDLYRVWTVPEPVHAALAWIERHPPAGLGYSGSTPGGPAMGRSWSAPDTVAYRQAQLEVGVAPDGRSSSYVRADGLDIWVSTAPALDHNRGPRVRVTIAGGCPTPADVHKLVEGIDVANADPALKGRMLPPGNPVTGLLCGQSLDSTQSGSARLSVAQADRLASVVNHLQLGSEGAATAVCPNDTGVAYIIVLAYAGHPDADLLYHAGGCQTLDNGFVVANQLGNPSFGNFQKVFAAISSSVARSG